MGDRDDEGTPLSGRSRPQYHYLYGSTSAGEATTEDIEGVNDQEQDSLIGETLVLTDDEHNAPNGSEQELQHVLITNGDSTGDLATLP